jgi:predicted metal-dependent HD superfamily phosphohydrolase
LILRTKSHEADGDSDAALLVDIDLAILGQPAHRFWEYEAAIRAEYSWVPSPRFTQRRAEILAQFLQRPAIFSTEPLRQKYEAPARANLQAAIERLRGTAALDPSKNDLRHR